MDSLLERIRPGIRALRAYSVPKVSGIATKLDANESPYQLSEKLQGELAAALAQVPTNRYPDPRAAALRTAIAEEYGVSEDSLIFGNGSDEIIQILIACFSEPRPGSACASILFPTPTFSVFHLFATTLGVKSIGVPTGEDFALDMPAMRAALKTDKPNVVFLARPNNPTGTLWSAEDVLELASEAPDTLFVSDEAYGEYATGSLVSALSSTPNLCVMKTLSKIGLAGLRVGFAMAAPPIIAELDKARAPYNVSSLSQAAAHWVLTNCRELLREQCREVVRERARVCDALKAHTELRVFPSDANLILFRAEGSQDAETIWQLLCDQGVLIRCFGGSGPLANCLRVTLGTRAENDHFLSAMRTALSQS